MPTDPSWLAWKLFVGFTQRLTGSGQSGIEVAQITTIDVNQPPKKTVTSVLNKAGTVEYYCRFHPNMKATLNVAP